MEHAYDFYKPCGFYPLARTPCLAVLITTALLYSSRLSSLSGFLLLLCLSCPCFSVAVKRWQMS
jgi:hypothetical protein